MKACAKCGAGVPRGRAYCAPCHNAYNRARWAAMRAAGAPPRAVTTRQRWQFARHEARKRGRTFTVSYEQWVALATGPCVYCGQPLHHASLDRVDNDRGYEADNVAPCCEWCNRMKLTHPREAFLEQCRRIAERHPRS